VRRTIREEFQYVTCVGMRNTNLTLKYRAGIS
jgi:hypothetical protein